MFLKVYRGFFVTLSLGLLSLSLPSSAFAMSIVKPKTSQSLPPFRDLRKVEIVPLQSKNNASITSSSLYRHVVVENNFGKTTVLNATKKPILFLAYWCPHCERVVTLWKNHHVHFPNLVFVGYPNRTTFSQAKSRAWDEIRSFHLPVVENQVHFIIGQNLKQYVPSGFPEYIYYRDGKMKSMLGEYTWNVWNRVI